MAASSLENALLALADGAHLVPLGSAPGHGSLLRHHGAEAVVNARAAQLLVLCDGSHSVDQLLLRFANAFPDLALADADARRFLEDALALRWLCCSLP